MLHFLTKSKLGIFAAGVVATKVMDSQLGKKAANQFLDMLENIVESKTAKNIRGAKPAAPKKTARVSRKAK